MPTPCEAYIINCPCLNYSLRAATPIGLKRFRLLTPVPSVSVYQNIQANSFLSFSSVHFCLVCKCTYYFRLHPYDSRTIGLKTGYNRNQDQGKIYSCAKYEHAFFVLLVSAYVDAACRPFHCHKHVSHWCFGGAVIRAKPLPLRSWVRFSRLV